MYSNNSMRTLSSVGDLHEYIGKKRAQTVDTLETQLSKLLLPAVELSDDWHTKFSLNLLGDGIFS